MSDIIDIHPKLQWVKISFDLSMKNSVFTDFLSYTGVQCRKKCKRKYARADLDLYISHPFYLLTFPASGLLLQSPVFAQISVCLVQEVIYSSCVILSLSV